MPPRRLQYTVEFGVIREDGDIKAFGAGVLSSFGELAHMASGGAQLAPFDPFAPQPKMSYKVRARRGQRARGRHKRTLPPPAASQEPLLPTSGARAALPSRRMATSSATLSWKALTTPPPSCAPTAPRCTSTCRPTCSARRGCWSEAAALGGAGDYPQACLLYNPPARTCFPHPCRLLHACRQLPPVPKLWP